MRLKSNILKLALFATGLSGIVAEYILATLATYFLGNSVLQWTMIVSVMMFAMGIGSRISKLLKNNLMQYFIATEFTLSVVVAVSALTAYSGASLTSYTAIIIYGFSIVVGLLIGLEIPLAVRLNDEFEDLRLNVASIIEKDYYGSLAGGILYAFVGLPYLGLTYMPISLGLINFMVAVLLIITLWNKLKRRHKIVIRIACFSVGMTLLTAFFLAKPILMFGEQKKYKDKIIFSQQSKYQKITITRWKNHYWLYINGNQQLSTFDEVMYHEPLIHPIMSLHKIPQDILILGGGDGCAAREVLKYKSVKKIDLIDLDPMMTDLATTNEIFLEMNKKSMLNKKVNIKNTDGFNYLEHTDNYYDIIIIDLPDPKTVELARLYSLEFYLLCRKHLRPNGLIITQAGSPYFATNAFICIRKTMQEAGFATCALHNQIITMGEWGWILGAKNRTKNENLKKAIQNLSFEHIETKWINKDAMLMMTTFGKNIYVNRQKEDLEEEIKLNTTINPILQKYYMKGNWDLY